MEKNYFYRLDPTIFSNSGSSKDKEDNRNDRSKFMRIVFEKLKEHFGKRVFFVEQKTTNTYYPPSGWVIKFKVMGESNNSIAFNLNNYRKDLKNPKLYAQLGLLDPCGIEPIQFADWLIKNNWTAVTTDPNLKME